MNSVDVIKRLEKIELRMSDPYEPMSMTQMICELASLAAEISNAAEQEQKLQVNQCRKVATMYKVRVKEEYVEATFVIQDDEDGDDNEEIDYICIDVVDITYKGTPVDDIEEDLRDEMWDSACRLVNELKHPM